MPGQLRSKRKAQKRTIALLVDEFRNVPNSCGKADARAFDFFGFVSGKDFREGIVTHNG